MCRPLAFLILLCVALLPFSSDGEEGIQPETNTGYTLGAYYYAWYHKPRRPEDSGWMRQAMRSKLQPPQLPKLGVYDSRDPKVIKEHIAQSVHAGIDFWSVSWWGPGRQDTTFRDHILKHADAAKLKYAALYESTGRLGSMDNPNYDKLIPDFEHLTRHYFDHPQYLKIDGKPVVFIYLTRVYFRKQAGREALMALRKKFPKLYLIGDDVFGSRYRESSAKQWNAVTAYDVYGQSFQIDGATKAGMDRLKRNYTEAKRSAGRVGAAFVPAIAPGYNDRAVRKGHPGRPRYFTDDEKSKEGDLFRRLIRTVAIPLADPKADRMIMITSFNEWYEDTQIEATKGEAKVPVSRDSSESGTHYTGRDRYFDYGSLYLDILRKEVP